MLISYLATSKITLPFYSLQGKPRSYLPLPVICCSCVFSELVDNTEYMITMTPGSSYYDAFRFSSDPLWQEAFQTRIEPEIDTYPKNLANVDKIIAEPSYAYYDNHFGVM